MVGSENRQTNAGAEAGRQVIRQEAGQTHTDNRQITGSRFRQESKVDDVAERDPLYCGPNPVSTLTYSQTFLHVFLKNLRGLRGVSLRNWRA